MKVINSEVPAIEDWLSGTLETLEELRKGKIRLAKQVIGQSLFREDLYILSVIDKCIRVIDGFAEMLKQRNLTCVGVLLRIQMDNCMRTYAPYVAADKQQVFNSVFNDETQLNKLKAADGKN